MSDPVSMVMPLWKIAPLATIVVVIIGIGYWAGHKSRGESVEILRQWIEELKRKG